MMKILTRAALVVALASSFVGVAVATDIPWTGANGTTWGDDLNWTGGAPLSADNAVFSGTFSNQPDLIADTATTGGVWMTVAPDQNTTISGAFNLNLLGNTIDGDVGLGILIDNTNAATLTISANPQLQGGQTWRNESGNLFTVSGNTETNGNALTLSNTGAGETTIDGVISGAGAVKISNTGSGATMFSNTGSSYTGQLTVERGVLSVPSIHNVSVNGPLGKAAAAQPVILGSSTQTGTLRFTTTSAGTKTFLFAAGGTGGFDIGSGVTITASGVISDESDDGKLLKTGAGTLVLSGTNTFAGGLTISGGTVSLANNAAAGTSTGTLTLNGGTLTNNATRTTANPIHVEASTTNAIYAAGGNFTLNGTLTGSGTIDNAGDAAAARQSIAITGDLSGFTGTVKINRAALRDYFRIQAPAATAGSNDASGARFELNGATEANPSGFLSGAEGRLDLVRRTTTDNNMVTFKMGELSGNGGRIQDDYNAGGSASFGSLTLEVGHLGTDTEWSGVYARSSTVEGPINNFTKVGSGSLTLGGDNEYNGVTSVNEGTLLVNGHHVTGAAYSVASGATLGGTGRISANVVVASGGILAPGASIGTLTVGGADISGTLRIEGAGSLIDKLMVGTVVLAGDGDFNDDGFVDAADYVVWRKDPGSFDGDFGYAVWRMNFGDAEVFTGGDLNIDNATLDLTSLGSLSAGTHVLAEYGTLSGINNTFAAVNGGLPSGFALDYDFEGNKIALVGAASGESFITTVVPEPGSMLLTVVGVMLMACRRGAHRPK